MNYERIPLLTLAKWCLLLLVLTPFLVDRFVFFPFIEGKTVFLRGVATLTLVLLAGFLLFGRYEQRREFLAAKLKLLKSPIPVLITLFLSGAGISTVFAKDSFRAFFGTVERGEGFVGLVFFTLIFYLALLLFERKEWKWFLGAVAATGIIFLFQQIFQLKQAGWDLGIRPSISFGNPSLLAGYYLFTIFASFIFFANFLSSARQKKVLVGAFVLSSFAVLTAVLGIFLTQTRGTYLGLAAGIGAICLYLLWRFFGPRISGRRKFAVLAGVPLIIIAVVAAASIFVFRSLPSDLDKEQGYKPVNHFIRRFTDASALQTRLIAARVSLRSIDPRNEGLNRFLFGWGQDNYNIAYNTYFDPRYFIYEDVWFDRAHNKVLDTFVMQGFLGLLTYLGIWGFAFWSAVFGHGSRSGLMVTVFDKDSKAKTNNYSGGYEQQSQTANDRGGGKRIMQDLKSPALMRASIIFFVVSYFIHLLFLFDSPSSNVAVYLFFAFVVFKLSAEPTQNPRPDFARQNQGGDPTQNRIRTAPIAASFILFTALIFIFLFFQTTWGPYWQMRKYIGMKTSGLTLKEFTAKLDEAFFPYTYVQERIRIDLLKSLPELKPDEGIAQLAKKTFEAADELIEREPYEPRHSMNMGQTLERVGGGAQFYQKAEEYYRKALVLVPNRPDLLYSLAQNLVAQGKMREAQEPLDKLFELSKEVPKAGVFYGAALIYASDEYQTKTFEVLDSSLRAMDDLERLGSALPVMQMIYNDFLAEFAKARDEKNFLAALKTAIRVEETWERQREEEFKRGKIKELPWEKEGTEKKSVLYRRILERFPEEGWGLVGVKE